jgi:transcriptional regulator with XRE-family HTH domain
MKNQKYFNDFSYNLYNLRKSHNLTQSDLAERLEMSRTSIAKIERGVAGTSIEKLMEIADIFDVSCDWLLGRSDNPEIMQ